jgi:hypothetical protein
LRAEKIPATDVMIQFKVSASIAAATVAEGQLILSIAAPPDRTV